MRTLLLALCLLLPLAPAHAQQRLYAPQPGRERRRRSADGAGPALGAEREGAGRVSRRAREDGREPAVDLRPGQRLPRPADADHGHGAGPAAARAGLRVLAQRRRAAGLSARPGDRRAAGLSAIHVRPLLRSAGSLWTVVVARVPPGVLAALGAARGFRQPREHRLAPGLRYASSCLVTSLAQCSGIPAPADHPGRSAPAMARRSPPSAMACRSAP